MCWSAIRTSDRQRHSPVAAKGRSRCYAEKVSCIIPVQCVARNRATHPGKHMSGAMHQDQERWNALKRIERSILILFVGLLPFVGISVWLISRFTQADWVMLIPAAGWAGFICYQWYRFLSWPCPNCGRAFNTRDWFMGTFSRGRHCVHCGISRFGTPS